MTQKIYAVVGSFAMKKGTGKGVHVFAYEPENGAFTHLEDFMPEINVGQGLYNRSADMFYITHEYMDRKGEMGGGGRALAFRLDHETGKPELVSDKETCAAQPSYLWLDHSGRYLLIPHHGTRNVVTRTVRAEDGTYRAVTESDDVTVAVFSVKEDGSLGEFTDAWHEEPEREDGRLKRLSHLHSLIQSPDGNLMLACDKGLDCIHGYRLDPGSGKLSKVSQTFVEEGAHPRYGRFHPTLPVFYQNCENSAFLHVWNYDSRSGKLVRVQKLSLLVDEARALAWTEEGASDLVLTADNRYLYATVRGLNVLAAFAVRPDGTLGLLQNIGCGGENPRGLCLAPDGRFLFVMNRDSQTIVRFRVGEHGLLAADGTAAECCLPGNMQFAAYGG